MGITTHGESKTRLYKIFSGMIARCQEVDRKYYGQKGIKVCDEWSIFDSLGTGFLNFKSWSLRSGYDPDNKELSIERINNDKNYCPSNCEWINKRLQPKNRADTWKIEVFGQKFNCLSDAVRVVGHKDLTRKAVQLRVARGGWDIERALTEPPEPSKTWFKNTLFVEYLGEKMTFKEAWEKSGKKVKLTTSMTRYYRGGWDFEKSLTLPPIDSKGKN
jgi:hypothetical protein